MHTHTPAPMPPHEEPFLMCDLEMSAEQYNTMQRKQKPNKYRNEPTTVDGIRFDSRKEARRYGELRMLEEAGLIRELECQPPYDLVVNGTKVGRYVADFRYWDNERNRSVVEDVKGGSATKTPVYRLKKALVKALYGIEVEEV